MTYTKNLPHVSIAAPIPLSIKKRQDAGPMSTDCPKIVLLFALYISQQRMRVEHWGKTTVVHQHYWTSTMQEHGQGFDHTIISYPDRVHEIDLKLRFSAQNVEVNYD